MREMTYNLKLAFSDPIIIMDSETGGLVPKETIRWKRRPDFQVGQRVFGEVTSLGTPPLELAAIRLDPSTMEEEKFFHTYVGPNEGESIDTYFSQCHPQAFTVNKLDKKRDEIAAAPPLSKAIQDFLYWLPPIRKLIIGGQNVQFDISFINAALELLRKDERFIGQPLELQDFSRLYFALPETPIVSNLKLETVCQALGIDTSEAHTALADCRMTAEVMKIIFERFCSR